MDATNAQENCFICKKSLTAPEIVNVKDNTSDEEEDPNYVLYTDEDSGNEDDGNDDKDSKIDTTQEIVNVKDDIETLRNASKQKKDGNLTFLQSTDSIDMHKACLEKYIAKASEVHRDTSDEEEDPNDVLYTDEEDDDDNDGEASNINGTDVLSFLSSAVKSAGVRLDKPIPRLKKLPDSAASYQLDSDDDDESQPFGGMDALQYLDSVYKSMMPPGMDLTKPIPRRKRSGD